MELSPSFSAHRIAKTLRLNYRDLKHRIDVRLSRNTPSEFVELNVEHLFSGAQCFVEVRSPAGFEIRIRTMAAFPPQLTGLISCFMSHGR